MAKHYKYIKIGLASPEVIKSWSHGEVKKHETINYRTLKPEVDGLFCEKIFGPMKDYQCACGKSKRSTDKGKVCEKCGVELTESKVRRERMGHIELASPVVHTWFLKNSPSPLAILLELKNKDLESIVYYASYIVTDPGKTSLAKKEIINEEQYYQLHMTYGNTFEALTGAEAIKKLLQGIDIQAEAEKLRRNLKTTSKQKRDSVIKRLEIVESFLHSDNKPEWMILSVIPVIPPDLRPMVQLDGGRFATTDLNDLYRRILNRNNRLKKQIEQGAPHLITKNEKRMLQEAVDALIDNSKRGKKAAVEKNHHLKSLSDMLRGKQGRFRQNLLGKRVDYSGRSVIVVGPSLKMYQCGVPREMALTLFKPFVIRELIRAKSISVPAAKKVCERQEDIVWGILEEVVREHPVLLNRAPTLHRLGIQAFEPVLIEGKAIRLHPLVCTAFNADFDGDQMAIHVPLSVEAQAEARLLMLASNNILNPKDGKPVVTPSQDMVLGNYYLTLEKKGLHNEGHFFKDYDEAYMAYKNNEITLQTRIFIDPKYLPATRYKEEHKNKYIFTTLGKMIFNSIMPKDFPYLNEPTEDNLVNATPDKYFFDPKHDNIEDFLGRDIVDPFKKKNLGKIIAQVFKKHQITETSAMLDRLKDLGFHYCTKSGITISMEDVLEYKGKDIRIKQADDTIDRIQEAFDMGLLTEKERKNKVKQEWNAARQEIEEGVWGELTKHRDNAIFMMADSGSRGSSSNFAQLAGMRGLMSNTAGEAIEVPVKANFREGLSVSEFFISTHGARKGSTDTALKTAESGYLTRRLVDVSQDVIISQIDCGTEKGMWLEDIIGDGGKVILPAYQRAIGRFAARDIVTDMGEVLCRRNELVDEDIAEKIKAAGMHKVYMRTNLTCNCTNGVCMKCYGRNLATNKIVEVGEAVGVVAAQSIGEPGTQLTMRTFHTGGVASTADITQGLPRVQELFEARKPKGKATISEINGTVKSIEKSKSGIVITIVNDEEEVEYTVEATAELTVEVDDLVMRGDRLMKGPISPKELLRIKDAETVQKYIVEEVQKVYQSQGVDISDKHIEIIVRQMMRKLYVIQEGSSDLLPGRQVSIEAFKEAVHQSLQVGGELPKARPVLLGITKAALASDSFLSACSFQETTRVLTQAAICSKKDPLVGLKENVIIGGLIPAGTGVLKDIEFECKHKPVEETEEDVISVDSLDDDYEDKEDEAFEEDLDDEVLADDGLEEEDFE